MAYEPALIGRYRTGTWTPERVREAVSGQEERLFAPWRVGRPENWVPDPRTKETVVLAYWLREQLSTYALSDADRRTQESIFHRWARSDDDLYQVVAHILNETEAGDIEQNRVGHRRWG